MVNMNHQHPFHMVDRSPWPMLVGLGVLGTVLSLVLWFHGISSFGVFFGLSVIGSVILSWWRDVMRESTFLGFHSSYVARGIKMGFILFILSEMMFFLSFFWAFFHSALSPVPEMGMVWPPSNMSPIHPWGVPLLNTAILLSSGASLTWSHHNVGCEKSSCESCSALFVTIILGIMFTSLQAYEYWEASFVMADSVYGSTFFIATGFHGFHVMMGSTFLFVCWVRMYGGHKLYRQTGYECAIWYWHFVDVIWIFLFICIYWWGS